MSERVISKIFQLLEKEAKIVTEILININAAGFVGLENIQK